MNSNSVFHLVQHSKKYLNKQSVHKHSYHLTSLSSHEDSESKHGLYLRPILIQTRHMSSVTSGWWPSYWTIQLESGGQQAFHVKEPDNKCFRLCQPMVFGTTTQLCRVV